MKINVKIYYYSVFDKGNLSIEIDENNSSVMDVLKKIDHDFGEKFEKVTGRNLFESFGTYFNVFLNGKHLKLPNDLKIEVSDEDAIMILHPVSGG